MKLTKIIISIFAVLMFAGMSFISCDINSDGYGTLAIRLPGSVSSRSGIPVDPAILNTFKYSITCIGPDSVETREANAGGNVRIPLAPGAWDIEVTVLNASGTPIGSGRDNVTISIGKTVESRMIITVNVSTIEMVLIEGGNFQMGSPITELGRSSDETYRTTNSGFVTLNDFYLGKYQITQDQWRTVMGSNPSYFHGGSGRAPATREVQGSRPVESINWFDALVFCNRLSIKEGLEPAYSINNSTDPNTWGAVPTSMQGTYTTWSNVQIINGSNGYRLPTEAQWEYACRAGTQTRWYFGNNDNQLGNHAWLSANSNARTRQVGLKTPNNWGLYDMHGNVSEWCWDWYNLSYNFAGGNSNPMGSSFANYGRVIRGGSWSSAVLSSRSAYRSDHHSYSRSNTIGFRVVRPAN
ncbi:MAG: formylglycine-generating enzyme family protein [Treponema sp.]|nr:formylglycine-generating enzyme family protein [Treponema sp.]